MFDQALVYILQRTARSIEGNSIMVKPTDMECTPSKTVRSIGDLLLMTSVRVGGKKFKQMDLSILAIICKIERSGVNDSNNVERDINTAKECSRLRMAKSMKGSLSTAR